MAGKGGGGGVCAPQQPRAALACAGPRCPGHHGLWPPHLPPPEQPNQGYDEEARYFDPAVSQAKAAELQQALDALVRPAFEGQLAILRELAFTIFQQQLQAEEGSEGFLARAKR